ncbi:hypothetical protein K458DRAFT_410170 [Lentithecium fluviatile CBS 122367]|uniref:Extracellular membrane protein CFEM domain-containing protein n=1 Tax=Lentithecium fluviatile CBS 122367 TaxID=1168545 RepID=A0A6G1IG22_9PLEO|nr:hypothetical protein K458DRAFT_410170 [Lentithecium fluviatile CBS 122367]
MSTCFSVFFTLFILLHAVNTSRACEEGKYPQTLPGSTFRNEHELFFKSLELMITKDKCLHNDDGSDRYDETCGDNLRSQCNLGIDAYFSHFSQCLLEICPDDEDRYNSHVHKWRIRRYLTRGSPPSEKTKTSTIELKLSTVSTTRQGSSTTSISGSINQVSTEFFTAPLPSPSTFTVEPPASTGVLPSPASDGAPFLSTRQTNVAIVDPLGFPTSSSPSPNDSKFEEISTAAAAVVASTDPNDKLVLSKVQIAGTAIGGAAGIALTVGVALFLFCRRRRSSRDSFSYAPAQTREQRQDHRSEGGAEKAELRG